jgi:hypothetical protein
VRGYRIEIELCMPKAVVAAKNDILIAYIVPDFDYIINKIKFVYGVRITISVACFHGA